MAFAHCLFVYSHNIGKQKQKPKSKRGWGVGLQNMRKHGFNGYLFVIYRGNLSCTKPTKKMRKSKRHGSISTKITLHKCALKVKGRVFTRHKWISNKTLMILPYTNPRASFQNNEQNKLTNPLT